MTSKAWEHPQRDILEDSLLTIKQGSEREKRVAAIHSGWRELGRFWTSRSPVTAKKLLMVGKLIEADLLPRE